MNLSIDVLVAWDCEGDLGVVALLAVIDVLLLVVLQVFDDFLQLLQVSLEAINGLGDNIRDFLDFEDIFSNIGKSLDLGETAESVELALSVVLDIFSFSWELRASLDQVFEGVTSEDVF